MVSDDNGSERRLRDYYSTSCDPNTFFTTVTIYTSDPAPLWDYLVSNRITHYVTGLIPPCYHSTANRGQYSRWWITVTDGWNNEPFRGKEHRRPTSIMADYCARVRHK